MCVKISTDNGCFHSASTDYMTEEECDARLDALQPITNIYLPGVCMLPLGILFLLLFVQFMVQYYIYIYHGSGWWKYGFLHCSCNQLLHRWMVYHILYAPFLFFVYFPGLVLLSEALKSVLQFVNTNLPFRIFLRGTWIRGALSLNLCSTVGSTARA